MRRYSTGGAMPEDERALERERESAIRDHMIECGYDWPAMLDLLEWCWRDACVEMIQARPRAPEPGVSFLASRFGFLAAVRRIWRCWARLETARRMSVTPHLGPDWVGPEEHAASSHAMHGGAHGRQEG